MRRLEGHVYPHDVLMGMPQSVPVRPLRGGLKEARGAPFRRARVSIRRADGYAAERAGAPLEGRLEGGARCAVKKGAFPYVVLMGIPQGVPVRPMSGGLEEARGAPFRRARVSVRRAAGHAEERAGAPHEWRLGGGERCAV